MITDKQIDTIALDEALMQVFCNVGEESWPANPLEFLDRCIEDERFVSEDEMIPWEPFENYSVEDLWNVLVDLREAFTRAIKNALVLDRG